MASNTSNDQSLSTPAPPVAETKTVAIRLKELEGLLQDKIITKEEYDHRREQILDNI